MPLASISKEINVKSAVPFLFLYIGDVSHISPFLLLCCSPHFSSSLLHKGIFAIKELKVFDITLFAEILEVIVGYFKLATFRSSYRVLKKDLTTILILLRYLSSSERYV